MRPKKIVIQNLQEQLDILGNKLISFLVRELDENIDTILMSVMLSMKLESGDS